MSKFEKIVLGIVVATMAVVLGFMFIGGDKSLGQAVILQTATLSSALAGPQSSVTILAQKSSRTAAIFSMPVNSTTSATICFSATCSATTGIALATNTPVAFMIDQNALYTGVVTAYAAASGTRIMVTEL